MSINSCLVYAWYITFSIAINISAVVAGITAAACIANTGLSIAFQQAAQQKDNMKPAVRATGVFSMLSQKSR